jgi:selenoprotein W-related protein
MSDKEKYMVSIEYCAHCNYKAQAIRVADELMSNYQHIIDQIIIKMGSGGIFNVQVNGQMLFSKHELERHASEGEIIRLFSEMVGSEIPVSSK